MGIFSSTKKEKIIAIFDIGSGSIGGAIARLSSDARTAPVILASTRIDIAHHEHGDFDNFLLKMTHALHDTAQKLHDKRVGAPEKIFCVLGSPWYLSQTRIVKMAKEKPFVFSRRVADDLLRKELSSLENEYEEKYGTTKSAPVMIEHTIVSVALNGYVIDDPIGKKAKALEMNIIISLSPQMCIDAISDCLVRTFHDVPVHYSSFMTSAYLAVRDQFIDPHSYLLVDVGGEVTDVAIVSKGVLKSSLSFPFGRKEFFRFMSTKLNMELRDAEELFSLYRNDALDQKRKETLGPLFELIEQSWSEAFYNVLRLLPHALGLPSTVFLTADVDVRDWFARALRNGRYVRSIVSLHPLTVITLDGPNFLPLCKVENSLCDPFLMIETIALSRKLHG